MTTSQNNLRFVRSTIVPRPNAQHIEEAKERANKLSLTAMARLVEPQIVTR